MNNSARMYRFTSPMLTSSTFRHARDAFCCPISGVCKKYYKTYTNPCFGQTHPYGLINPYVDTKPLSECERTWMIDFPTSYKILGPGMILMKNYVSLRTQDCDESSESLQKGLPVVSISIGDTALFMYSHTRHARKLHTVFLHSGDILIFGGRSRLLYHGVRQIFSNSAPVPLLEASAYLHGCLNLTLKKF